HKVALVKQEDMPPPPVTDPNQPPGIPGGSPPGAFPPGYQPPRGEGSPPGGFGGFGQPQPQPKKDEVKGSRIKVTLSERNVDFNLDLVLAGEGWRDMRFALDLMVLGLKAEVDLAGLDDGRFALGEATRQLGEKGLSKYNVPP